MRVFLILSGNGPLVIITSHHSIEDPGLVGKLTAKGIVKFLAYEIPVELAASRYGGHFNVVLHDVAETDDLRVLDYNGERAWTLFHFDELGKEIRHEPVETQHAA
ncbi:MAG TPA: hypothetical protein EYN73_02410 [Chromatiaceae bacterium]|jgi:hypothetical protein|nr:hypothetical protein [Chromatiaceae bacterium]HIN81407.1 hypothetical protein [Chromatiales bacterium]HIA07931.1 hypothetical protein [Chromatiaceae bacterium]HIB83497.1 hypothetical protein [Chromatiaceae bacterium]HIO14708.1 hypothetical protein [Chromatiales bacterium]